MLFSILVPVYNVKKYISQCFDSILNQTFDDYEVIIVDDGSTDGSSALCDEFADGNSNSVRVFHKENGGLISARRTAISQAQGDYCVFLDSDDMLCRDYLRTARDALIKYSYPDIIICSFLYCDDNGNTSVPTYGCNEERIISGSQKKELYSKMICTTELDSLWTKVIRTDLLKNDDTDYEKYYSCNMSEDLLQSLYPVTNAERTVFIPDRLYLYRYNPSSISRTVSTEAFKKNCTVHVYNEIKAYLPRWEMDTAEWRMKLDANWLCQSIYNLDRFYLSARNASERDKVLSLDWKSTVSPDSLNGIGSNPYLPDAYKKVWSMLIDNDIGGLKRYFLRKKTYTSLKRIKRKIIG